MAVINGTSVAETLDGTGVDDTISGGDGADIINGGAGDDLIYGHGAGDVAANAGLITATLLTDGIGGAVFAAVAPGDANGLYVVQRGTGQILRVDTTTGQRAVYLDIPDNEFSSAGEGGLLSVAFHPDYATNGRLFVFLENPQGNIEVREYDRSSTNPPQANAASGDVIMFIDHSQGVNHYGGTLAFGPDGYLYISVGDGGGPGADPQNDAQNPNSLLGKVLRIDVNGDDFGADAQRDYAIPNTNPFVGVNGADEVWALGLRNPYRMSFDSQTGDLWIGDVGEDRREEINFQADGAAGGVNYGWRILEGTLPFAGGSTAGLTPPVFEYDHTTGVAVVGGAVYRGAGPAFNGHYWLADFSSSRIWTLREDGGVVVEVVERTSQIQSAVGSLSLISSFGEDASGNLYVITLAGQVFRLDFTAGGADASDTLRGDAGNDTIYGGVGADILEGGANNDNLFGGLGNDRLEGGPDVDSLSGDDGADTLDGGAGADVLSGGAGSDTASYASALAGLTARLDTPAANTGDAAGDSYTSIENVSGTAFNDTLAGDAGDNVLSGLTGADTLEGNGGADTLFGGDNGDTLRGGAGLDNLYGGAGADILDGGADFDYARYEAALNAVVARLDLPAQNTGEAAGDTYISIEGLVGSSFNDLLAGAAGTQELWGRNGDDVLIGGAGADLLQGEAGFDTASYANASAGVVVRLLSTASNTGDAAGDVYASIEWLRGSTFIDTLAGDNNANIIWGGDGDDQIAGEGGADELHGELGRDRIWGNDGDDAIAGEGDDDNIWGGAGADRIWGNEGNDAIDGQIGNDNIWGAAGDDHLWGGDGNDAIDGQTGQDIVEGQNGADRLFGGDGNDQIFGGADDDIIDTGNGEDFADGGDGNDIIHGLHGADVLIGGAGNDILDGGDFNDVIYLGGGEDSAWGGAGDDTFVATANWGVAVLNDFDHNSGDVISFARGGGLNSLSQLGYAYNAGANLTEFWFNGNIVWVHGFADMSDVILGP